ncbi:ABC transporter substrate-binding protein [Sinorhizobium meliloti]|uniref:ABC transporter substrate-binding protein n=1 Tax=Rhizobium meliloti TaxID=382 RepID=UPI001294B6A5|nr:ABC transporter substrate-binding protein [Sinorhizobium meliloti]MQU72467.1 PhnD/SsuA/transferrin family substrate-binding protein [Sinorhizobium meliloti]
MTNTFNRRIFLRGAGLAGLSLAAGGLTLPHIARAASTQIKIVSNPGLENATLNALMEKQGYFKKFGVDALVLEAPGATGPFDAIAAGAGDVCMVSGYNMVLSRIEQGAKVKIVGAGMKKAALTVFAEPGIGTLADLKGKTVAVGPKLGLLHALMLQLLKEKRVDATQVNFVDKGSNDQAYQAVVKGEADACCSSISHLNDKDGLVAVGEGNMWEALPRYTFQTAYASDAAIAGKREGLVAVMAAYGSLYDYLMTPEAQEAFFAARQSIQKKKFDEASAKAVWDFNQVQRPYTKDLSVSDGDIDYMQDMFIGLGSLKQKHPVDAVADISMARDAAKLLG